MTDSPEKPSVSKIKLLSIDSEETPNDEVSRSESKDSVPERKQRFIFRKVDSRRKLTEKQEESSEHSRSPKPRGSFISAKFSASSTDKSSDSTSSYVRTVSTRNLEPTRSTALSREASRESREREIKPSFARIYPESKSTILEAFEYLKTSKQPLDVLGNFHSKRVVTLLTYLSLSISNDELRSDLLSLKDKFHVAWVQYCKNAELMVSKNDFRARFEVTMGFLHQKQSIILSSIQCQSEMEEDYLSLWQEENGLSSVQLQNSEFVSWESDLVIDVEVQEIIKSMNNTIFMVKHSSLNHLIILLTHSYYYDPNFLKLFFRTFQTFVSSETLFKKLFFRYCTPATGDPLGKIIKNRVSNAIKFWMKDKISEFKEIPALQDFLLHFLNQLQFEQNPVHSSLLTILNSKELVEIRETTIPYESHANISKFSPEDIAKNLCLFEFDMWASLRAADILKKNPSSLPAFSKLSYHFNAVSQWVCSSIIKEERLAKRARVLQKFIEVAIELDRMNNFSGLFAITCGINNSGVLRLKFTFAEIPEKLQESWKTVSELMSPMQNYASYRTHIKSRNPPLIPYLGQYLTDLTMINDGNPDFFEGLINFHKRQLLYKVISEMELTQVTSYNFKVKKSIIGLLQKLECVDELTFNEQTFELSKLREPRGIQTKKQLL